MRVALKIAYDGTRFHGFARQPDVRTVEGEVLRSLLRAKLVDDPRTARFAGASRTDRGVSAVGNVIAFNTSWRPDAVVGAFNDKAEDVGAWAFAEVPDDFHPRHAIERWYRYHLFDDTLQDRVQEAMTLFVGDHDFGSFTTEPSARTFALHRIDVLDEAGATVIDIRARSFGRGMVRRIVAAAVAYARAKADLDEIQGALGGSRRDFGMVPPEPLFLMDVNYDMPFRAVPRGKVLDHWHAVERDSALRLRLSRAVLAAIESRRETSPWPNIN